MARLLPALLALAALGAGCRRETRVDQGDRDQVLHFGNGAEPRDVDPGNQQAAIESTIDSALFEGVVNLANDGLTVVPAMADHWEISEDGRTYTFHLRPGTVWSDGSPLTSEDFLYAFRRLFSPALASENAMIGYAISGSRDEASGRIPPERLGVAAPDPRTFVVHLDRRQPSILAVLSSAPFYPVPKALVERLGEGAHAGTAWTRPGTMVSNGPFVLSAWHPNKDLVVTRNPRYWDRAHVRLAEVRFYPTDNVEAEERAFRAGQLHETYSLPVDKLPAYRAGPPGVLHLEPLLAVYYVAFNTRRPPFANVHLRRALALAIDRDQLVARVLHETGTPAHALTRPGTGGYDPPSFPDFNPARAREELAASGYPGGAGFPAVELKIGYGQQMAEALQQTWLKTLGIRVSIAKEEFKVFLSDGAAGNFDVAQMGYLYGLHAPEAILLTQLGDSPGNYSGWKNAAFEEGYRRIGSARNEAERKEAFDAMERALFGDAPVAPLYYRNQAFLISPHLRGWRDNAVQQVDWRALGLAP